MQSTTLTELEWIHDCPLLVLLYDASGAGGRSLELRMRCPADLGYAKWEGRTLRLVALDVALMQHFVQGVAGPEMIDAVRPEISAAVRRTTIEARRMGVRFPALEFTVSFFSGSTLEVICHEIQIDIES